MEKRPNILKLATKISLESMTYIGITYDDCEYKALDALLTDEMAEVFMRLKLNTPRTVEEVARRCGKDVETTRKILEHLQWTGTVRTKTVDGQTGYFYPVWVPGIMEGFMANKEQCAQKPILAECFEEYTRKRLGALVPFLGHGMSFMRVIPVEKAIRNESRSADFEELSHIIENADAISVGPCSCRRSRRLMGEGCGHLEEDICIYLNENARNYAKIGAHRLITKEEAYEILKRAEDNGLVHEVNQTDGADSINSICNCCGCSCYGLRIANYFRTPEGIKSNYVAKVDADKCTACGSCVENCQSNALKLGRKLCAKKPLPVEAPDLTVNDVVWSKKYYDVDFRTNRSDVTVTGTAPCKAVCPLNIPVQGCIKLISEGRYEDAEKLIKRATPFVSLCGSVCDRQCEKVCARNKLDSAVAIADICRSIAAREAETGSPYVPPMVNMRGIPFDERIAVIGAGPAGLSCAYFLSEKGYPVTVFEKSEVLGGTPASLIPDFRLDRKSLAAEIGVLRDMGVEFKTGIEVGKDITLDELRSEGYKAFFLGIGAQKHPNGKAPKGVIDALEFLSGKKKAKDRVAVIGGGREAVDCARTALRRGAKSVTVVCPSIKADVAAAKDEGVEFKFPFKAVRLNNGCITAENIKTGETEELAADMVIRADGYVPDDCYFRSASAVKWNDRGFADADPVTRQTAEPDIFAGGDVTGDRSIAGAIAAGREAAVSISRFVHDGQTFTYGRDRRDYKALDRNNIALPSGVQSTVSHRAGENGVLDEDELKCEAGRCLGCGTVVVNENMCLGCGICTTKCAFGAIRLERYADSKVKPYYANVATIFATGGARTAKTAVRSVVKKIR